MASFDFISFIIGLLLGAIIMLVLVWIAYYTRTFLFTYCPTQARACNGPDYYNNPGEALANGANIDDILFLNDQDEMFYKRVPKTTNCVPESNQTVHILYPQYCQFSDNSGLSGTYRSYSFGSNIYKPANGLPGPTITTSGNCDPTPGIYIEGIPLLKWDPSPILQ